MPSTSRLAFRSFADGAPFAGTRISPLIPLSVVEKFNPEKHEVIESITDGESGIIAEESQKGYIINGEVLRHAKLKVYK